MKTENIVVGVGALGGALKFDKRNIQSWDGTEEYFKFVKSLTHNPSISKVYLLSPSDYQRCNSDDLYDVDPHEKLVDPFPKKSIVNFDKGVNTNQDMINFREEYISLMSKNIKEDLDFSVFYLASNCFNVNIPGSIRKFKTPEEFKKVRPTNYSYTGQALYYLNESKTPWFAICNDPRYDICQFGLIRDCYNPPVEVISQYSYKGSYKHIEAYEDEGPSEMVESPVTFTYSGIEKLNYMGFDYFDIEGPKQDSFFMVAMQTNGVDGLKDYRFLEIKEWVLDFGKDISIYGKWPSEVYSSYNQFKGMLDHDELLDTAKLYKYTLIIPVMKNWITAKYCEMISCGVIPFFHPDYDTDNELVPKDHFIRVYDPNNLWDKIEFLEQNPEARIQILTDLRERWITESVKDGTEVYNILNKFVDQLGLQLEPKIQEKGPSGLELFF